MNHKRLATCLLAIGLLAQPLISYAGFDEGVAASNKGDYQTAFKEWKPLADQGDAKAQSNLGVMYALGQGLPLFAPSG